MHRAILVCAALGVATSTVQGAVTILVVDEQGKPLVGGAHVRILIYKSRVPVPKAEDDVEEKTGMYECKQIPTDKESDFYIEVTPKDKNAYQPVAPVRKGVKDRAQIIVRVPEQAVPPSK
jgi:hypothetical protein